MRRTGWLMWCDLYLIADTGQVPRARLADVVARAIAGGVTAVQLRDKSATASEMLALARDLRACTRTARVPFLVNDDLDLALAADADGVHLGPEDMPLAAARARVPAAFLVGFSAGTADEAREAERHAASYLGVGAAYATRTKGDAGAPIGPAGIAAVRAVSRLPLIAIGGITVDRVPAVCAAGADGVAVARAILLADNPESAARTFRGALTAAHAAAVSRGAAAHA